MRFFKESMPSGKSNVLVIDVKSSMFSSKIFCLIECACLLYIVPDLNGELPL